MVRDNSIGMSMNIKNRLLDMVSKELEEYMSMPTGTLSEQDKKQFINGVMTACRIAGISYSELEEVVQLEGAESQDPLPSRTSNESLHIPTFIRQG